MQILKIKNYLLLGEKTADSKLAPTLQDYIFGLELSGKHSWDRTKFLNNFLLEEAKRIFELRKEVLIGNAKKNKDGKILYLDGKTKKEITEPKEGTSYQFEDVKKLNDDLNELLNDEYVIDVTPANSRLIDNVRTAMENDNIKYSGMDSARLSLYFEAMEPQSAEIGKKEEKKEEKEEK